MAQDYQLQLSQKLEAARKRVRAGNQVKNLKAAAPDLFEIMDTEISLELNKGYGEKPLSYEEYLESHGAVRGIKKIRSLLDSKEAEAVQATQEVTSIEKQLKQFNDDKKQK